jgi:hybrid cluster-associated redox disulfide protein
LHFSFGKFRGFLNLPLKIPGKSVILTHIKLILEELHMTITKDTIIGDILTIAPQTAPLFLSIGMHCLGCPASRNETVEQACMVHGVDPEALLAKVNEMIAAEQ